MFYIIIIIWIILDLVTKNLANEYLQNKINILWDFVYLKFIRNPWIAFWIEVYPLLLKVITISLIILIFYYYKSERKEIKNKKMLDISFWLILAWAIWNGIERILNSNVIDFIWVKYFSIFNLADSFITIGAIIYIIFILQPLSFCRKGKNSR